MEVHEGGEQNLNWAHNSLVDAKAQSDIVIHPLFVPYINKGASIHLITEIFTKTEIREWKKEMEPIRPVHAPWKEIDKENDVQWKPDRYDSYLGPSGGSPEGPSSAMCQASRSAKSLACIFFSMVPLSFFVRVAEWTKKYCYEDWVVEKFGNDRDGKTKKRRHFVKFSAEPD